jgi:hypothetical protein
MNAERRVEIVTSTHVIARLFTKSIMQRLVESRGRCRKRVEEEIKVETVVIADLMRATRTTVTECSFELYWIVAFFDSTPLNFILHFQK